VRTVGAYKLREEIESHLRSAIPTLVLAPPHYSLRRVLDWSVEGTRPPLRELDLTSWWSQGRPEKGLPEVVIVGSEAAVLVDDPAKMQATHGLLGVGFLELDWGAQRALCDFHRRRKLPLLVYSTRKSRREDFLGYADYDYNLEIGVGDRLYKMGVSKKEFLCQTEGISEDGIASWVGGREHWRYGRFPLQELLGR
jgi:hypothetical protein